MELQKSEQDMSSRKKTLRIILSLFIGLLIVFTLFSNTLLTMSLPKVATAEPRLGSIEHVFTGSGMVRPREVMELIQQEGWLVKNVHVKEGELVTKGQTLVSYDSSEAEWQLKFEEGNQRKLSMEMEKLQDEFKHAAKSGDPSRVQDAKTAIENDKMDLEIQEQRIQKLQESLKNNQEMVAPFDGFIQEVNVREGFSGTTGGPDILITDLSKGFEFEIQIPTNMSNMLKIGESLVVKIEGTSASQVEGQIAKMEHLMATHNDSTTTPSVKTVLITLQDTTLQGGEQAQVNLDLTKESADELLLILNQAIHDDSAGKYVYTVMERSGPLGNAYYVNKTYVTVIEANDKESAVQGMFLRSQVVIESSHPLQEGERVRL